jgi:hypothetical protein
MPGDCYREKSQVIKELKPVATKKVKNSATKPKRASKSKRIHVRRLKQEARKAVGTPH